MNSHKPGHREFTDYMNSLEVSQWTLVNSLNKRNHMLHEFTKVFIEVI